MNEEQQKEQREALEMKLANLEDTEKYLELRLTETRKAMNRIAFQLEEIDEP